MEDQSLILNEIKLSIPNFNKEYFFQFVEEELEFLHYNLRIGNLVGLSENYSKDFLDNLLNSKDIFHISSNIDSANVQHIKPIGLYKNDSTIEIKLSVVINIYDRISNNTFDTEEYDRFWSDIWEVTYEYSKDALETNDNATCPHCGAPMQQIKDKFLKCNYCQTIKLLKRIDFLNYKIKNISLMK